MNFREVRDKLAEIIDSIRRDPHPAFAEIRTYRYRGHSMAVRTPRVTAPRSSSEEYRLHDPITRLRAQLAREEKLTNEQFDLTEMDKKAKRDRSGQCEICRGKSRSRHSKSSSHDYTYVNGERS